MDQLDLTRVANEETNSYFDSFESGNGQIHRCVYDILIVWKSSQKQLDVRKYGNVVIKTLKDFFA